MRIGYIIGSHVVYNPFALSPLLDSMVKLNGIDPASIVVITNGSTREHQFTQAGVRYLFRKEDAACHFIPIVSTELATEMGVTHWLFLNCTSRCGPRFRELVETGFDQEADCTLAGILIPLAGRGSEGRAMNDFCMYRHEYLMAQKDEIISQTNFATDHAVRELEGVLFAIAPKKARYPNLAYTQSEATDVYQTGTPRITEYFGSVDWFRFKKNWGQFVGGEYEAAKL